MSRLIAVSTLCFCTFLFAFSSRKPVPIPEHIENTKFDAKKVPIPDEPAIKDANAKAAWAKASKLELPPCESHGVWTNTKRTKIQVTSFKNRSAPVKGVFDRYAIMLITDPKSGTKAKIKGNIDLSSWNSNNVPRDNRVMRFVFGVEEKGNSVAPFSVTFDEWKAKGSWDTTAHIELKFRGKDYKFSGPVKIQARTKRIKIKSVKEARFTYANSDMLGGIQRLIERCNHQFLGSFVDLRFESAFKSACN